MKKILNLNKIITGRDIRSIAKRFSAFALTVALLFVSMPKITGSAEFESTYELPWLWPVPGSFKITSLDYYANGGIHNSGQCIDIGSNGFTGRDRLDIISATSGTVLYIQNKYDEDKNRGSGWGNYVIVRSGNINIVYGHLKTVTCGYGEIKAGDVIGKMGNTGNSTGVHLHLQAYPSNANSTNADILVFEQYRQNPLYYEQFQFLKGLQRESVRYKDWLNTYYTKLSGSYYNYSGGLDHGFDVTAVSAEVTVINSAGAPIRRLPLSDNSYITDTVTEGKRIQISGYYYDAHGALWLSSEKGWIKATDVGFYDYKTSSSLKDGVYPSGSYGAFSEASFGGVITSVNVIDSVSVRITSGGEELLSFKKPTEGNEVNINGLENELGITALPDGDYVLTLSATERAEYPGADPMLKENILAISKFTIDDALSDKQPPVIEAFEIISADRNEIKLYVNASDNKKLALVSVSLSSPDGNELAKLNCQASNGRYEAVFDISELPAELSYVKLTAKVYDGQSNTDTRERTMLLPKTGLTETRKAVYALKARSGPGLSYGQVASVSKGSSFTITETAIADGYVWGKHSKGWTSIIQIDSEDFATYVSGGLFSVALDPNGGKASSPSVMEKAYYKAITLPQSLPEREGCVFLGWALSSDAKTPDYAAGGEYKANATAVLFAVWEDKVPPTVENVTSSTSEWTNGDVIITVNARDNSEYLLYSFDGGESWQSSNAFAVKENGTIPSGSIIVKDRSGNTASWENDITVSRIDKTPPSVNNARAEISTSGKSVKFSFFGAVDSESGISLYEITVSKNKELSSPSVYPIKSGDSITLENGVYYIKLTVTDNAGNSAEKMLDRFRVGAAERLSSPEGLTVASASTDSVELVWLPTPNADSYKIELSKNESFEGAETVTTALTELEHLGLSPEETYYVRISAVSDDGIYLTSLPSETKSFITLSGDSSLYGFEALSDAEISHELCEALYIVPYQALSIDITAKAHRGAVVEYFSDILLSKEIKAPNNYSFGEENAEIYIKITAENGASTVYKLKLTRAAENAAVPLVEFNASSVRLEIGEQAPELSLSASVTDGGRLEINWYSVYNGALPVKIGEGERVTPVCDKFGDYEIYAVITNTNEKCAVRVASVVTENVQITVTKKTSEIEAIQESYIYNGKAPRTEAEGYYGDGEISFKYYSDALGKNEIDTPINAGTYYASAVASETDEYAYVESALVKFTISKAENQSKPSYEMKVPSLRNENGYITVKDEGVEYRLSGSGAWLPAGDSPIAVLGGTYAELRFAESTNYLAGPAVKVESVKYTGASDIIPNASSGSFVKDGCFFLNDANITPSQLLSLLENSIGVKVLSSEGALVGDNSYVGTGDELRIEDSDGIFLSLTVIVLGDIDGDGTVTYSDAEAVLKLSNGMIIPENELMLLAADVDGNGVVNSVDAYFAYLRSV